MNEKSRKHICGGIQKAALKNVYENPTVLSAANYFTQLGRVPTFDEALPRVCGGMTLYRAVHYLTLAAVVPLAFLAPLLLAPVLPSDTATRGKLFAFCVLGIYALCRGSVIYRTVTTWRAQAVVDIVSGEYSLLETYKAKNNIVD